MQRRNATKDAFRTLVLTKKKLKLDSYFAQIARTEELKTLKQLYLNKAFASTRRLQEERKHNEEAPHPELQLLSYKVLDSSLSSLKFLSPANVSVTNNNKQSKRKTRDGSERLCQGLLKLAETLPATDAEAYFGILVQERRNLESFFTCCSRINDLKIFLGEQIKSHLFDQDFENMNVQTSAGISCTLFFFMKRCIGPETANECNS